MATGRQRAPIATLVALAGDRARRLIRRVGVFNDGVARRLLVRQMAAVPYLVDSEVACALRGQVLRGNRGAEQAGAALARCGLILRQDESRLRLDRVAAKRGTRRAGREPVKVS